MDERPMCAATDAIRVLHVDDEPELGALVETFLERADDRFEVETATSAREGLERLEDREFDCVVSDYDMPGDTGIEFLDAIREEYPDLPFILFTGKGSEEIASEAISAGVTDYLQKEPGTDQYAILANRIENTVEGHRARQRIEASERQLRNVYERITDGFFAVNTDWEYEYVNEEGAALTGRTREELVGASVWEAFPGLIDSPFETALRTAMEEQASASVEEYYPAHESWYDVRVYGDEDGISIYFQDVTERVERRRELRETKRRFELALNHAGGGVWEWNVETDDLFWDENLLNHLGIPADAFTGTLEFFEDRLHPADASRVWEEIEASLASGSAYSVELRMHDDEGEWHWFDIRGQAVRESDGDRMVGVALDITERKERERELERTREFLSEVERLGQLGAWEFDADGEVIWSEGTRRIHAVDEEFEPTLERGIEFYHPEDRASIEEAVEAALGDGEAYDVEARLLTADDELRWVRTRGVPVGDGERVRGYIQDVTDRRERERERTARIDFLQHLYDVATDPALSPDETITRLLESGPEKLGLPSGYLTRIERQADEPGGGTQTIVQASGDHELLQPGASSPLSHSYCRKTIERDGLLEVQDARHAGWADDPAYETFDLGCYIGTSITVDGELYGTVFFGSIAPRDDPFTDEERTFVRLMSQLVRYELERKRAAEERERRTERLEQFASVVSHDLRNPLSVAEGHLELYRDGGDSDHLDAVERAHDRMGTLIDDLLDLAREGDRITEPEPLDLAELVASCWQNVETAAATLVADVSHTIRADRSRLAQLLENLFRNAVVHGGDDVTIRIGDLETGFYVADDGPGIPGGEREAVFDAGYSVADGGTGVGLAIVEEVVEAHGWAIEVTESESGGARFEITGVSVDAE